MRLEALYEDLDGSKLLVSTSGDFLNSLSGKQRTFPRPEHTWFCKNIFIEVLSRSLEERLSRDHHRIMSRLTFNIEGESED